MLYLDCRACMHVSCAYLQLLQGCESNRHTTVLTLGLTTCHEKHCIMLMIHLRAPPEVLPAAAQHPGWRQLMLL